MQKDSLQDIIRASNSHYGINAASHDDCIDTMINYIRSRYRIREKICGNRKEANNDKRQLS